MIAEGNKWYYIAISSLSALLEGKLWNHHGDFYCLSCFNSYTAKNRLKEHEEICDKQDSCRTEMPNWFEKILKYNPGEKSLGAPFCDLSWFRMFTKKRTILSKQFRKILHRGKS